MALYSSSLVAKWRKTIASDTPAALAISFVVVPRKPRCENRPLATRRICRRRSSPAMRAPFVPLLFTIVLFGRSGLVSRSREVSTYLPLLSHQSQAIGARGHPCPPKRAQLVQFVFS